jgi:scyllo-inositol 2-dehydrogenase (NADP+)
MMSERSQVVQVGIAGLGRSGWKIHAETIAQLGEFFRVVAVADPQQSRRDEARARFDCKAYATPEELTRDESVQLVVVATPNHLHAANAIAAMEAGKDVLCEKPMALSQEQAAGMIDAAARTGRVLTVFQNRRFEPCFEKVREIVAGGMLGRIVQIRMGMHGFSRRWDWQTLKEFGGGTLNNAGSHFLDQLLSFFPIDEMPDVFCHTDRALTLGDAEDHCVIMLRGKSSPLVQLELSSACGYPQDNWLVMGTRGTLHGKFDHLEWKTARLELLPARTAEREAVGDRSYNNDKIEWEHYEWRVPAEQGRAQYMHSRFYASLYETLRRQAQLTVTPAQVRRQMRVLDACRRSAESL